MPTSFVLTVPLGKHQSPVKLKPRMYMEGGGVRKRQKKYREGGDGRIYGITHHPITPLIQCMLFKVILAMILLQNTMKI